MPETPWWLSLILAWVPFVATMALYLYFIRTMRAVLSTRDGCAIADVVQDLSNEIRKSNARPD